jgi:DNA-binding MarR family transcriptional regulator
VAVDEDLDALEAAIEQLFRLSSSRKVHARRTAAAGVTISQPGLVLLRRLTDGGPMSLGELSRVTDMDLAAAGRQVRQLEDEGLVRTSASAGDGRVTMVRVTPKGTGARRRLLLIGCQHMSDVLDGWSKADRKSLARLLPRFVEDMRAVRFRASIDALDEMDAG